MNPERLIGDAKAFALELVKGYQPETPDNAIRISGELGYQATLCAIEDRKVAGQTSEYDAAVLERLAYVLSGGRAALGSTVTEQQLLDLEWRSSSLFAVCQRHSTESSTCWGTESHSETKLRRRRPPWHASPFSRCPR